MATWGQSKKLIAAWIHRISNNIIKKTGHPPLLTLHNPPTIESYNCPNLKKLLQKLHTLGFFSHWNFFVKFEMWHTGLVRHNNLKIVLV